MLRAAGSLPLLLLAACSSSNGGGANDAGVPPPFDGGIFPTESGAEDARAPLDAPGDEADGAGDAADAATYPAPHPALPQEVTMGGPVLVSPRIVPITYDADPMRAQIEAFIPKLGASSYWKDVTSEYGVGPAKIGRPVHLGATAPTQIDDAAVKTWIASMLDGTHPEFDPPDGNTMYAIYYPPGTTYTLDGTCQYK